MLPLSIWKRPDRKESLTEYLTGGCLPGVGNRVFVAPIEMLRRFVDNNQLVEDPDNIVLRCLVLDWLTDRDL